VTNAGVAARLREHEAGDRFPGQVRNCIRGFEGTGSWRRLRPRQHPTPPPTATSAPCGRARRRADARRLARGAKVSVVRGRPAVAMAAACHHAARTAATRPGEFLSNAARCRGAQACPPDRPKRVPRRCAPPMARADDSRRPAALRPAPTLTTCDSATAAHPQHRAGRQGYPGEPGEAAAVPPMSLPTPLNDQAQQRLVPPTARRYSKAI